MITVIAYAKINLGLRILGNRPDGFHDIETVFHRVNIYDEMIVSPSSTLSLICTDPGIPTDEGNLCIRAAILLREMCHCEAGARIELRKKIPVGAGLGGGSADAAASLLALNDCWKCGVTKKSLRQIALRLGSDVPYFLETTSAHATGRGELLTSFHLDLPYWIVVVHPGIHISTAWAYDHAGISHPSPVGDSRPSLMEIVRANVGDIRKLAPVLQNDLEQVVFRDYPEVANVKATLLESGAELALMSGSGSAVYALFRHEADATHTAESMQERYRVFITPPHFEVPSVLQRTPQPEH